MKEIHAKMLRKHLQRLEPPLEGDDKLETDHSLKHSEDSEQDVKGMCLLFVLVNCCFSPLDKTFG